MNGDVRRAIKLFALRIERRALEGTAVIPAPLMGAEDFSYVLQRIPGCMLALGAMPDGHDGHDHVARCDVAAPRTDMRSRLSSKRHLNVVVAHDNTLYRDHGIRAVRHDGPGRDGHGTTRLEPGLVRTPGRRLTRYLQRRGELGRTHGEAVHGGAREGREVDGRTHALRDDPSAGFRERHELRRKRPRKRQNPLLRLLERE